MARCSRTCRTSRTGRTSGKTDHPALANIKTMGDLLSVIVRYRPLKSAAVRICPLDDIAPCGTPHGRQPTGRTSRTGQTRGTTDHPASADIKTMGSLRVRQRGFAELARCSRTSRTGRTRATVDHPASADIKTMGDLLSVIVR